MSTLINKVLFTRAGYGLTILRIAVGIIFAAHGSQNSSVCLAATAWQAPRSTWKASAWRRVT
jgi:uncharacterized membrane protein YphA (DoxX/SURF4 family)